MPSERGRRDPSPAVSSPAAPGSAPSPGSVPSPEGAGAPGGAGSRPGRRRLHSSGGSGVSAARALLGAPAGTREGRGRAQRGWGVSSPRPLSSRRGAPSASRRGSRLVQRAEAGTHAGRGAGRRNTANERWSRGDSLGRPPGVWPRWTVIRAAKERGQGHRTQN